MDSAVALQERCRAAAAGDFRAVARMCHGYARALDALGAEVARAVALSELRDACRRGQTSLARVLCQLLGASPEELVAWGLVRDACAAQGSESVLALWEYVTQAPPRKRSRLRFLVEVTKAALEQSRGDLVEEYWRNRETDVPYRGAGMGTCQQVYSKSPTLELTSELARSLAKLDLAEAEFSGGRVKAPRAGGDIMQASARAIAQRTPSALLGVLVAYALGVERTGKPAADAELQRALGGSSVDRWIASLEPKIGAEAAARAPERLQQRPGMSPHCAPPAPAKVGAARAHAAHAAAAAHAHAARAHMTRVPHVEML